MEFKSNETILSQIVSFVKREIFSGRYGVGAKIPPIREFAAKMSVNPNTVAKAYQELEAENLIYTDGTLGKFVSNNRLFLQKKRQEYLEAQMSLFKDELKKCGVDEEEFLCLAKK